MAKHARSHTDDLRGASRLAIEATRGVTALVEEMHATIAGGPAVLGHPLAGPAKLATGLVYGTIRGVTQLVGAGIDLALAQLGPVLGASAPGLEREVVRAVLNGVLGDYLSETGNPLAIEMSFRDAGVPLELTREALQARAPSAGAKLVVLIHGSCMTDLQWMRQGHDHGAALARDLGYTPLYLHYNSGLHISTNGRAFAALLDQLVTAWPVPVEEVVLLGHSMGGLVARSACHVSEQAGLAWRSKLRALVTLGTPHHGAPLERGGNWIDVLLGVSRYSAPLARLGRIRSAGITDLRYGNVRDEDWQGRDRFARGADPRHALDLPAGVRCYAVAGTLSTVLAGRLRSDGIVPVDSALGTHATTTRALGFPTAHRHIALGTGHVDLLGSPAIYAAIRTWLAT
jgi:pimeloyl-ACP methyl ester carboxylesterase